MATKTDITLYTCQTPNGIKISIALEELGLQYEVRTINMMNNEQKEPWFLEINPNGRIPAITDTLPNGEKIRVFESGAILEYLVERYDTDHKMSYPRGSAEHFEVLSWLHWSMGGLGPMQGQANHFKRYAPEKIQYGIDRYTNEARRLYRTMDAHLAKSSHGYMVGDRVTIADIVSWGWVSAHSWAGVSLQDCPNVEKWLHMLLKRPGFDKGRHVPTPHTYMDDDKMTAEALEERAAKGREWVQKSMAADAK
ncbi:hypothetical protein E4U22_004046 [Claviceps purpurea]|nr:hypothetical protein E4U37_002943 [Claviceps purpurea]KAG6163746.1 hypothetical protein E4U11_001691 [Claviceps purpurea]KAG6163764.1 hypothetical protein E4U51_005534 [Claviceps purpurea]KAG6191814.1 hypothetical protein E4U36_004869 [Claviceps purpurea]KAG6211569.1 hypothetical protein E4U35_002363 [Claviceps purpurea]